MRGATGRREASSDRGGGWTPLVVDRGGGWTPLVVALALVVSACGAPDGPEVEDDPPSASEPADEDGTEPEPQPDGGEPDGEADGATDGAADAEVELAAMCDDLEGRPYDPPAEEQPAAHPDITNAEAVPDIEPLDDEQWDEEWDGGPPPTPLDRARFWAANEAPEHLGGVWLDQDEGGVSVIGFTEDVDTYAEEIRSRFSEHLWVVRSDNAMQDLEALQLEIDEQEAAEDWYDDGEPRSGAIVMQGLRPSISRVTMMLLDPDDERLQQLSERYGADRICFEIMHTPTEDDAEAAPWEPADEGALSPDTTTIDILLNERGCASGQSAEDRLADPDIVYDDDAVTITARIVPPTGPQDCPGNPDTPATVELDEPLGDRELLDGSHDPPRTPDLTDER